MPFFPELSRRPLEELMKCFIDPGREKEIPKEEGELWLDEVAVQIARASTKGIKFLLDHIPVVDERRLRAILIALPSAGNKLSARARAEICRQSRSLLGHSRPLIVAEAADVLRHLGCREAEEEVSRLLHHPSPYVVGSALRFLARHFPDRAGPLLEGALDSEEPIIRQNAIDELDELEYFPALPRIKRLVNDADADVRQAALTAVRNLEELGREQKASG